MRHSCDSRGPHHRTQATAGGPYCAVTQHPVQRRLLSQPCQRMLGRVRNDTALRLPGYHVLPGASAPEARTRADRLIQSAVKCSLAAAVGVGQPAAAPIRGPRKMPFPGIFIHGKAKPRFSPSLHFQSPVVIENGSTSRCGSGTSNFRGAHKSALSGPPGAGPARWTSLS